MLKNLLDEVARNGALQRITSARGFLERPFCFVGASSPRLAKAGKYLQSYSRLWM